MDNPSPPAALCLPSASLLHVVAAQINFPPRTNHEPLALPCHLPWRRTILLCRQPSASLTTQNPPLRPWPRLTKDVHLLFLATVPELDTPATRGHTTPTKHSCLRSQIRAVSQRRVSLHQSKTHRSSSTGVSTSIGISISTQPKKNHELNLIYPPKDPSSAPPPKTAQTARRSECPSPHMSAPTR